MPKAIAIVLAIYSMQVYIACMHFEFYGIIIRDRTIIMLYRIARTIAIYIYSWCIYIAIVFMHALLYKNIIPQEMYLATC